MIAIVLLASQLRAISFAQRVVEAIDHEIAHPEAVTLSSEP